jgi:hypothetical protein
MPMEAAAAAVSGSAATALAAGVPFDSLLQRRIVSNVIKVLDRVYEMQTSAMGPQPGVAGGGAAAQPSSSAAVPAWHAASPYEMLKTKVFVLLTHASSEKYLARAAGSWSPWL